MTTQPLKKEEETLDEFLKNYHNEDYPHPSYTADNVIFSDNGKLFVLLIKRKNHPCKGMWAFPGGFVEPKESGGQAAYRELKEETSLENVVLEQLVTVSTPNRDPRGWCVTTCYVGKTDNMAGVAGDDAAELDWFAVELAKEQNTRFLTLSSSSETLKAKLEVVREKNGKIDLDLTTSKSDNIAFDHAKIILFALEKLETLQ